MIVTNLITFLSQLVTSAAPPQPKDDNNDTHHSHRQFKRGSGGGGGGGCNFPGYDGMVAVQTNGANAGWAMHYDQRCDPGTWCPYACEPGLLMGQWDPDVSSYSYPGSQYGGLYCQEDGTLRTPFEGKAYCYEGKGTVVGRSGCGSVAFCQTVLPGNEEMLIPTVVGGGDTVLAVPGTEYWAGTAAHYYINPPGVGVEDACKWGDSSHPWGNWSPYVAGANMDDDGNTFVKIGWNPIYLEEATPFRNEEPEFGIRIVCDDDGSCDGLPCSIDPSVDGVNGCSSGQTSSGAGGGTFCVVTAKNKAKARIEVFAAGQSGGKSQGKSQGKSSSSSQGKSESSTATTSPQGSTRQVKRGQVPWHEHSNVKVETVYTTVTVTERVA